jgi:cation diffusion facilitator CzcD-associated flavoprotein CzcO
VRNADVVVIGAGQAGLSAAHHLARLGVDRSVVLDANRRPGGAWQHRWSTLTMSDVHGVTALPGLDVPPHEGKSPAREVVPEYFRSYEQAFRLPVERPVRVDRVEDGPAGTLLVHTDRDTWQTRALVNATGTWDRPFVPAYPGRATFRGRQLHTVDYDGPDSFASQRVVVVGGGASAVQILGELAPVASTTWVTRRPPVWRDGGFDQDAGRAAVALVEERVRRGLPPQSVVSVTGLLLRPQEQQAAELGAYRRRPMFARVESDGVRWADGRFADADAIIWATGFRPALSHLAPLRLREATGGIRLVARDDAHTPTTAARDHRVQLVGYGPSASTIGANRAGRVAARSVLRTLSDAAATTSAA